MTKKEIAERLIEVENNYLYAKDKINDLQSQINRIMAVLYKIDNIDKPETAKKEYSEIIITNEMFNEEVEKFLNKDGYVSPTSKYTSINNSATFISTMIYDLHRERNLTNIKTIISLKLKSKGEHYNKAADRYANIKDALARNKEEQPEKFANWSVVDKINSYKDKHIQWLIDTKGTEQTKGDLQEAYIDVICYCIMANIWEKYDNV